MHVELGIPACETGVVWGVGGVEGVDGDGMRKASIEVIGPGPRILTVGNSQQQEQRKHLIFLLLQ